MSDVEDAPASEPPASPDEPGGAPQNAPETPSPAPPTSAPPPAAVVPIGRHEPLDGVCGRIDAAPSLAVVLHAPSGNRAMSGELGMRRVARHVEASGRVFAIATRSPALVRRARAQGVPVASNPRRVHWRSGGKMVVRLGFATILLPPFGRYAQYLALSLLILAVLAALYTAGPSASVRVYPRAQTVEGLAVVRVSPRVDAIDLERRTLPATIVSVEREILLAVPATGEVVQGLAPALATLRLENPTDAAIAVPAGAVIFADPDSVAFEVDSAVTVPAGGRAFAAVTARAAGARGNVPAGAITRWRDPALAPLAAANPEPASGGLDGTRRAVAPADIRALESLAAEIAAGAAPASILADALPGYGIIARSATAAVTPGEPSARPGAPASAVFLEVRTTFRALAVEPRVLEALARALLERPAGSPGLIAGTVLVHETSENQLDHPDGAYTSEFRITARFARGPSPAEVEDAVKGRSPEAAVAELRTRYGSDDVEIDLTPGWAPRLPRFGFRLDVEFGSRDPAPREAGPDDEAAPPDGP